MTGAACDQPLFPACTTQWGLQMPVAPIGIHIQPSFPTTCECLWQAREHLRLDARQECILEPEDGLDLAASETRMRERMPWMHENMIVNGSLNALTRADARRTRAEGLCNGRGIHSVQLPFGFLKRNGFRLDPPKECRCFPGYVGVACEQELDKGRLTHGCVNDCSGRGACINNQCRCRDGTWGIDCSLPGDGPLPSVGADVGGSELRPRIYVYEMPPRFTSWFATFRRGDWTRDHWYGCDVIVHKQLLASPYRTLDPDRADFFFIPLYLSLGYYTHRYYFKHFTHTAQPVLRDALRYVRTTWPYLEKHPGRHLMVMTQDQGTRFVRREVPGAARLIVIHHWGAPATVVVDGEAQGDHIVGQDIVVPPFLDWVGLTEMNRWLPDLCAEASTAGCTAALRERVLMLSQYGQRTRFKHLLFFSGKMNFKWGKSYSLGARAAVWHRWHNDSRFLIHAFDQGVQEKLPFAQHAESYATAKFCLAPAGYGFSSRQYEAILIGCVPVTIQDDVEMAFEEVLPWARFSVRLKFADIERLDEVLEAIPDEEVLRMRRVLGCVWPRMLWLANGLYGSPLDTSSTIRAARPHDAFHTLMWTLRRRLGKEVPSDGWQVAGESCDTILYN